MIIINGKELAGRRELLLRNKVDRFIKLNRRRPSLLAIELSSDPGSRLYLKLKKAAADRIGIEFEVVKRSDPAAAGSDLKKLSADGIFIQHPPGYDKQKWQELADRIPPKKDVDCLTTENLNLVKQGKPRFLPATVKAVLYCLGNALHLERPGLATQGRALSNFLSGKNAVILGRSPMVGLPLFWRLKSLGADVSVVHSGTSNQERIADCESADVLISSVGKPGIVTADMVKPGAIVIDCGSPVGDVDFESVSQKAAAVTPVPGGVGPLTVVSLMENVVKSAYHADREGS